MIALQVEHFDQVPVARLPTDVDAANVTMLADRLAASVGQQARDLVVDLTQTRYLDSTGIEMLFRLSQRLSQRGANLHVVIAPHSPLVRLAEIVSLPSAAPVYGNVAEAVKASMRAGPEAR
jgi:anti-anti-sigma factor